MLTLEISVSPPAGQLLCVLLVFLSPHEREEHRFIFQPFQPPESQSLHSVCFSLTAAALSDKLYDFLNKKQKTLHQKRTMVFDFKLAMHLVCWTCWLVGPCLNNKGPQIPVLMVSLALNKPSPCLPFRLCCLPTLCHECPLTASSLRPQTTISPSFF